MVRFFQTRSARKFFRQRLAVAALIITATYLLVALLVWGGLITKTEADTPIGPRHLPGFLATAEPEERLEACEALLDRVESALKKHRILVARQQAAASAGSDEPAIDVRSPLEEGGYLNLQIADLPVADLKAMLERNWREYEQLAINEELASSPELLTRLAALEAHTAELYELKPGVSPWVHQLHLSLGTDRQGRSIFLRAVYSIKVAMQVGVITALIAVVIGAVLGAAAAYFGGWVDHVVIWLYTMLSSIPYLVLLVVLVYAFYGTRLADTLYPLYIALIVTFWIGPCRVIRGETLKLKELEYVQAARALGFGHLRVLFLHILPNTAHLILINFSLMFIGAIKSEVILSFLGLGVKGEPSWGIMIEQSSFEVLTGFYWQIGAATAFMFVLVLAFNILADAIQDAYDPKHS